MLGDTLKGSVTFQVKGVEVGFMFFIKCHREGSSFKTSAE